LNEDLTTSTLDFEGISTVNVADGKNLAHSVTNLSGIALGTLNFLGSTTVGGNIGSTGTGSLTVVNFQGGTANLGYDIYAVDTNINNGATLNVTSSRNITGNLTQAGTSTLALGTNTLTVSGTYTLNVGQTLSVGVNGVSNGSIAAAGGATVALHSGVTLNVSSTYIPTGTTYTLITGAGSVIAAPDITVTGSNHATFNVTGTGLDLILTATRANPYNTVATADANGRAAGQALEVIGQQGATGDMANVLTTLDSLSTNQLGNALNTLVPDMSSGDVKGSQMMMGQLLTSVGQRLGFWRNGFAGGLATGDMFQGAGFWTQGMGSHASQGTLDGIQGYRANTFGTTIGVDKLLGRHGRIGLAGGYSFAGVRAKTPGNPSSDINSFQTTLYGGYDSTDLELGRKAAKNGGYIRPNRQWWYADGMLAFGANSYDSRREIWLGSDGRVAKADHYGQQYSAKTELGYTMTFEKTKALEITPFTSLEYAYLYMNQYKEHGADSLNLNVQGQGYNTLEQGLGLKFGYPIYKENVGTFVPSIKGAWLYDYISDMFQSTSSFAGGGPSFTSSGAKPAANGFLMGAELAFMNIGNMTLTANYDVTLRDAFLNQTYYLTARFDF
jgi:outer membrane autotransporter protein